MHHPKTQRKGNWEGIPGRKLTKMKTMHKEDPRKKMMVIAWLEFESLSLIWSLGEKAIEKWEKELELAKEDRKKRDLAENELFLAS